MKIIFLSIFLAGFFNVSFAASCNGGGSCGTRGGGDFLEWSFYDVAKAIVPVLLTSKTKEIQSQAQEISRVLSCLTVQVTDQEYLDLDKRSVIAINDPSLCLVTLSRAGWKNLTTNESRVRLVIHELVSLASIYDFQYEVSLALSREYFRLYEQVEESRAVNKSKIFQSSGIFKIPSDVTRVRVTVVGGGGGGGGGHLGRGMAGGGGGGGAVRTRDIIVKGISEVVVAVGRGGSGAVGGGSNGQRGETSSFGSFLFADGGGGGFSGFYNSSMGYGGTGGGSGGGGGGHGVSNVCSGAGGRQGSPGANGHASTKGGAGGAGSSWDELKDFITLAAFSAGNGGSCLGPASTYNGGGGGGGLIIGNFITLAEQGRASDGDYSGTGGSGGEGFGAGGGGGTGAQGAGGAGAIGVVYIEYFSVFQ